MEQNQRTMVVIPVRDEGDALVSLLPRLKAAMMADSQPLHGILIDDGSKDGSGGVAAASDIPVVRQDPSGKSQAVRRGFETALQEGFDAAVVFDGDGQHPVEVVPRLMSVLCEFPIVKGTRFHPASEQIGTPRDRAILNQKVRCRLQEITGWPVTDPQCGLIGLQRRIIELILPRLRWQEEWEIEFLLHLHDALPWEPYPIIEIPIPAIYAGLPGAKQEEKYRPENAFLRLEERLTRQMRVIDETLACLGKRR